MTTRKGRRIRQKRQKARARAIPAKWRRSAKDYRKLTMYEAMCLYADHDFLRWKLAKYSIDLLSTSAVVVIFSETSPLLDA